MPTLTYLYNIGSIFSYKILFIRSFIYSEINTFGLSKCSKIIYAFNIFVPIPVLEMVYLKTIQKITPMDVSVSGTVDQKAYLIKFRGGFSPVSPPWIHLWWPIKNPFVAHRLRNPVLQRRIVLRT